MAINSFAEKLPDERRVSSAMSPALPGTSLNDPGMPESSGAKDHETAESLLSVVPRALMATAAATVSAIGLFLLSRALFQVPYDWLNLAEVITIPIMVAFPIAAYIFHQADRLASARVALARQSRDNERQKILIHELNHRVKNMLATVMSICAQTARGASDIELFVEVFNERLVALAGAHDVLSRQAWEEVSLHELSEQVLAPYGDRIRMQGSQVLLRPAAAVSLSLVLHELATNAAKHGSLSGNGAVAVSWAMNGVFTLQWTESGGPAIAASPIRVGFGSRLIKHVVERELGGTAHREYHPKGLRCNLRIPAANLG